MKDKKYGSVFEWKGIPQFTKVIPLALQHVVAMVIMCTVGSL